MAVLWMQRTDYKGGDFPCISQRRILSSGFTKRLMNFCLQLVFMASILNVHSISKSSEK